jgi:4-methyl-5(b-hydroxyethyl)-thiazole monophosphate biosynthesis
MSKVLMMLSHDVEDIEALGTRALLVRSGIDVVTSTFQKHLTIETAFGLHVEVDHHLDELDINNFDMLIIPGGKYVSETIDLHDKMQVLATSFHEKGKVIAAICAGPRFLGRAGLLKNKRYTAYPGSEQDIIDGIYEPSFKALTDLPFITAKGAGCVYEFAKEIITHLKGLDHAEAVLKQIQFKP